MRMSPKATTRLAVRYETVVVEDLNIAGMTRNRRLARAIAGAGFGENRRMLACKTTWNGGGPLVPLPEDVLGLWWRENQTHPLRTHLRLHWLRPGPGPGRECGCEPA